MPSDFPSLESLSQYEAVRLFIERAQAVQPTFQVTNEEVVGRLDVVEEMFMVDYVPED